MDADQPKRPLVQTYCRLLLLALLLALALGSPPAAAASTDSFLPSTITPAETVVAFYAALQAREFTAAYALLSPAAQAEQPFAAWADGYLNTDQIDAQASPGATPDSVRVQLWVSDGNMPHIHGFAGTWQLVQGTANQPWLLDDAQIVEVPPPSFPFDPRPTESCTPVDPDPATPTHCDLSLNVPVDAGSTITVTAVGPQPLAALLQVDCGSLTNGLSCLSPTGPPSTFSVQLVCFPALSGPPACPIQAGFSADITSLNGGPLSETLTVTSARQGTLTYLVLPTPPVTFPTLVPPPPPSPAP